MSDLECPYCEEKLDICHDDGFGYEEDIAHEMECSNCEKNFIFYTSISFYYEPQKADCLNGEAHKYKPTTTVPTAYTRMRCEWCDEERALTDDERRVLNIPEKNETEDKTKCVHCGKLMDGGVFPTGRVTPKGAFCSKECYEKETENI